MRCGERATDQGHKLSIVDSDGEESRVGFPSSPPLVSTLQREMESAERIVAGIRGVPWDPIPHRQKSTDPFAAKSDGGASSSDEGGSSSVCHQEILHCANRSRKSMECDETLLGRK